MTQETWTTIRIRANTRLNLQRMQKYPMENRDDVLKALIESSSRLPPPETTEVQILAVDGDVVHEVGGRHDVVFRLGDKDPVYYRSDGKRFEQLPGPPPMRLVSETVKAPPIPQISSVGEFMRSQRR